MYQQSEKISSKDDLLLSNPLSGIEHAGFFTVLKATAVMRYNMWKRYKADMIGSFFQVFMFVGFFFLFATAVGFRGDQFANFGTREIFIFFMGGMLLVFLDGVALWAPLNSTVRDLTNGTLEAVYLTPSNRYAYYSGYTIGFLSIQLVIISPMLLFLTIYSGITLSSFFILILVLFVGFTALISMGVIIALSAILWKQVQGLAGIIGVLMQFATGAFIPVQSLPVFLQPIAWFLPHTWAYELIRYYTLEGWSLLLPLEYTWALLFLFIVGYFLLANFLLKRVERHAKTKGLHLI